MKRLLPALLALALLLTPTLARAQLWTPSGEPWFSEIQDIGVAGSYGVLVPNEGTTGTTNNLLACYAAGGLAITCTTSTTLEVLGPVQRNGGTTGSALIANSGIAASCQFDGATTAGNYVQRSLAVAGNCTDVGATFPSNARRVIGTVVTTNGASGVYPVFMYSRGVTAPPADVQTFTANGTWTKPLGVTSVYIFACGQGGGGGGGQGAAAGGTRTGGAGGGGGYCNARTYQASSVPATLGMSVAGGANNGLGGTTGAGTDGTAGLSTNVGSLFTAPGGGGGAGNTAGGAGGGGGGCMGAGASATAGIGAAGGSCLAAGPAAGTVSQDGSVGASSQSTGGSGVPGNGSSFGGGSGAGSSSGGAAATSGGGTSLVSGGGGGAGGGVNAVNPGTAQAGTDGGASGFISGSTFGGGGAGGTVSACGSGGNGVTGTAATSSNGGFGGGGGASVNNATGCTGGNGGAGGGGGGGGGGGTNVGGAGGSGGSGYVIVIAQ